jgi:GNAT superfamily N-acetyltransferase
LAAGSIRLIAAPGRIRRNMPDPVPVMVLGRLAVDQGFQGRGLGRGLLRDAVLRTIQAAHVAGIRALLVHALHGRAAGFYTRAGFTPSPLDPLVLMVLLKDATASLAP